MRRIKVVILFFVLPLIVSSQNNQPLQLAKKAYEQNQLIKAKELLELFVARSKENEKEDAILLLADIGWKLKKSQMALYWYKRVAIETIKANPVLSFRMAELMARMGKQDSALLWLSKTGGFDLKLKSWENPKLFYIDSTDYKVQKVTLNSRFADDMLPIQSGTKVYWLTNRRWSSKRQKINSYNKQVYPYVVFTDLAEFEKSCSNIHGGIYDTVYKPVLKAINFSTLLDTKTLQYSATRKEVGTSTAIQHLKPIQGLPSYNRSRKEYSFISSISHSLPGQLILVHTNVNVQKNTFKHKIYEVADIGNGAFKILTQLPFVDSISLSLHAALDPSAKFLVLSKLNSNGDHDLFFSKRSDSLHWEELKHLTNINTKGDEIFPVFDNKGNLFFSSNGLPGLGGWDLYKLDADSWLTHAPVNMSYPINTVGNDFGWTWLKNDSLALFTSDRLGKDEIFKVSMANTTRPVIILVDSPLNNRQSVSNWVLEDTTSKRKISWLEEKVEGLLEANVKNNHTYRIKYLFEDGSDTSMLYLTPEPDKALPVFHLNAPVKKAIYKNLDSGVNLINDIDSVAIDDNSKAIFKQVYFDFDSDQLTLYASNVLDSIFVLIQKDSTLYLSIAGFTDCIGDDRYNKKLSFKRQKSVVDYLLKKGVSKKQLHTSFYGSNYQRSKCSTQKLSSSNKLNRRVEVFIGKKRGKQWLDYWREENGYTEEKKESNRLVMKVLPNVRQDNINTDSLSKSNVSKWQEKLLINAYLKREDDMLPISIPVYGDTIEFEVYDNGSYDKDTISIIVNKKLLIDREELSITKPIKFQLPVSETDSLQLCFIANSIGLETPNSALLIINDINQKRVEVPVMSDLQRNRKVIIRKVERKNN